MAGATDGKNPDGGQRSLTASLPPISGRAPVRPNEGMYNLRKTSDGGYVLEDLRFNAVIAPDGQVTFKDRHGTVSPQLFGFPLRLGRGDADQRPSLMGVLERTLRGDPNRPVPLKPIEGFAVADPSGIWDPALRLPALGREPLLPVPFISVAGTFDLTDELMSSAGHGWYRYEKAKFLSATFDFRMKMALERHRELLRKSLADLPAGLDALWTDPRYAPREKRGIVCLLWSEVDAGDPESRAAADAIAAWIRRRLPAGGSDAYGTAEIAACATAGGRAFAPYSLP